MGRGCLQRSARLLSVRSNLSAHLGNAALMVNYILDDLHAALKTSREEDVWVDPNVEEYYGKFGWVIDPDGNRIELWNPVPKKLLP
jgi:hypothetical protein